MHNIDLVKIKQNKMNVYEMLYRFKIKDQQCNMRVVNKTNETS
jgi:hypothetical protein